MTREYKPGRMHWVAQAFWHDGIEYDEGGLPVHLYPFPLTIKGEGPADEDETFRMGCWCMTDGCLGR